MNFTISVKECSDSYDKYVKSHPERYVNQKIEFDTVVEILQDFNVYNKCQPSKSLKVFVYSLSQSHSKIKILCFKSSLQVVIFKYVCKYVCIQGRMKRKCK